MDDKTRQRILLGVVVVLGFTACVLYPNNRDLRSEGARLTISPEELQQQVDERARKLIVDVVRDRRHDLIAAGHWLDSFYQSGEGSKRPEGLWIDKHPDFEGIGAWLFDIYLAERLAGADDAAARQKVTDAIRHSGEWRQRHPASRSTRWLWCRRGTRLTCAGAKDIVGSDQTSDFRFQMFQMLSLRS